MRREVKFFLIALVLGAIFIFSADVYAKVLISEVKTKGENSNDEFIELYNYSSSTENLTGWSIFKYTKSGNEGYPIFNFLEATIAPFSYLLLAHSEYMGAVTTDYSYSTNILADNNYLYLFNNTGEIIDTAGWGEVTTTYRATQGNPSATKSLSRLPDDDTGNWQDTDDDIYDFIMSDPDPQNSFSVPRPYWLSDDNTTSTTASSTEEIPDTSASSTDPAGTTSSTDDNTDTPTSTPELPDQPDTPTTTSSTIPLVSTSSLWAQIKINEFVSNPESSNEWLEIYNPSTSSLDLTGGYVCDERGATSTYACKAATGTVPAAGWLMIDLLTNSFLNNDGDAIYLKNPETETIDNVIYAEDYAAKKGQSLARYIDGADNDIITDWAITTSLTPGAANIITAPVSSSGGGSSSPAVNSDAENEEEEDGVASATTTITYGGIVLNELLPNPTGSDADGEFIEIINETNFAIDLTGWKISDGTKTYSPTNTIKANEILSFARTLTKISLNNTSREEVSLYAPDKSLADYIYYDSAGEGEALARTASGTWQWSASSTPGYANYFTVVETGGIVWQISAPGRGNPGETLIFNAEDTADERGGDINFVWDFGDNATSTGEEVAHVYGASSTYHILLTASSSAGSFATHEFDVLIGDNAQEIIPKIVLSEILINPEGDDSREFIEIFCDDDLPVDLSGWIIGNLKKTFVIPSSTFIYPDKHLVFYKAATEISLNNSEEQITLATANGNIADTVVIAGVKEGESYSLIDNSWQTTNQISPGEVNKKSIAQLENAVTTAASVKTVYKNMTIGAARASENETNVIVTGFVSVLPAIFGVQYFYIFDGQSGIQIYNSKKDFLDFKIGDEARVVGTVGEASGVKRIRVKDKTMTDILSIENPIQPIEKKLDEITEEDAGKLIAAEGDITEIKTNYLYLDNEATEIKIYFKKGANLNKAALSEGAKIRVVGIVENSAEGPMIMPRSDDDLILLSAANQQVAGVKEYSDSENASGRPLWGVIALVGAIILALVIKNSWAKIIAWFKK